MFVFVCYLCMLFKCVLPECMCVVRVSMCVLHMLFVCVVRVTCDSGACLIFVACVRATCARVCDVLVLSVWR